MSKPKPPSPTPKGLKMVVSYLPGDKDFVLMLWTEFHKYTSIEKFDARINELANLIAFHDASVRAEALKDDFRMDELDAVMVSVDKWLEGEALNNNPATRAAEAREIALKAIEEAYEKGRESALQELEEAIKLDKNTFETCGRNTLGHRRALMLLKEIPVDQAPEETLQEELDRMDGTAIDRDYNSD